VFIMNNIIKDATIYSSSLSADNTIITYRDSNYGYDEILELMSYPYNNRPKISNVFVQPNASFVTQ
jgi:hypothetical protein